MPSKHSLVLFAAFLITVAAPAQVLTCSSNNGHRQSCRADTSNGVRMVRQVSGSPCTAGYSWGYEVGFVWVDHGCRADFAMNVGAAPQASAEDVMRSCKSAVSARQPNVPLAFIEVDEPRTNGASQMANFRVRPPNGQRSGGYCDVFQSGRVNVVFSSNQQGQPGNGSNNGGGYGFSAQDAMRSCKNMASDRLRSVPLAYISVYRGTDTGNGSYMINFHAQPPTGPNSSGFCILSKNGQMQNFQFDPGSGGSSGGGSGGQSSQDAMESCKNAVSAQLPNVPRAYIEVDSARVNGGSLMANFKVRPPNAPRSDGYCDVFKNGRVNVVFNR